MTAQRSKPRTQPASKQKLRLWIRLLGASRAIEAELRRRLRAEFGETLPRFDVMAALQRRPHGMIMTELSRYLMVSNGNVTGIVDRLVSEGLLQRGQRNGDRRTSIVQLTRTGRDAFRAMAAAHEQWVGELLAGVTKNDARQLTSMLKAFRSNWEGRE
jgi:DNA-binding MarR family transcriptional regulator